MIEIVMKPRVIIESPFGRNLDGSRCSIQEYERNGAYLRDALRDSLKRGEAPFASHAIYPLVLDDTVQDARRLGMESGFAWGQVATMCVVYSDLGITKGMHEGIERWRAINLKIVERTIR